MRTSAPNELELVVTRYTSTAIAITSKHEGFARKKYICPPILIFGAARPIVFHASHLLLSFFSRFAPVQ